MVIADPEPLWLRRSLQSVLGQSSSPLGALRRGWPCAVPFPGRVVASVLSEELSGVDAARVSRVTTAPGYHAAYADALALAFDEPTLPFVLVVYRPT